MDDNAILSTVGGSLGLFLGFSCLDFLQQLMARLGSILQNSVSGPKTFRINFHPQLLDKFPPKKHIYKFI
jgi:hypothetical protein